MMNLLCFGEFRSRVGAQPKPWCLRMGKIKKLKKCSILDNMSISDIAYFELILFYNLIPSLNSSQLRNLSGRPPSGIIFAVKYSKVNRDGSNPVELMVKNVSTEKRRHPRVNVDLPVRYGRTNLFLKYGRVVNASEGGLLVHLPEEMGVGQRLALKLFFPSRSEFNTLETSVQVVWKDIHLRKDWTWDYRTGVKFVDIPPEHTAKLKGLLTNIVKERSYTA